MRIIRFTKTQPACAVFLAVLIWAATTAAHEWMAPKDAAALASPIAADAQSTARGEELFLDNCAACHGRDGGGLPAQIAGLDKDTPKLPQRLGTHSDGDFFWKIQQGRAEMPSFAEVLDQDEIWDIINFIKTR
jgi:mono/diheme cytochrome c family protein